MSKQERMCAYVKALDDWSKDGAKETDFENLAKLYKAWDALNDEEQAELERKLYEIDRKLGNILN